MLVVVERTDGNYLIPFKCGYFLKRQMTPPLWQKSEEELKSLLMTVKEESEKAGLKLNIPKMKIMASGPITSWQINGETMERVMTSSPSPCAWRPDFPGAAREAP